MDNMQEVADLIRSKVPDDLKEHINITPENFSDYVRMFIATCNGCGKEDVMEQNGRPKKWARLYGQYHYCNECCGDFVGKFLPQ